jgi:hypothetical protein
MPLVRITCPVSNVPDGLLDAVALRIGEALDVDPSLVWVFWEVPRLNWTRVPHWAKGSRAPVVSVKCRSTYTGQQLSDMLFAIQACLSDGLDCPGSEVFVTVDRVQPGELLKDGRVWLEEDALPSTIALHAVGVAESPRTGGE